MNEKKLAKDLKSGDIVFDESGKRIGIVTQDAEYIGWSRTIVVFFVMQDDEETMFRVLPKTEVIVQPWQPSQAI